MIGTLAERLRWLLAKRRLADSASDGFLAADVAAEVVFPQLHGTVERNGPALEPYSRWADIYLDYWLAASPDYGSFVPAVARRYGIPVASVLELGCGAGRNTAGLAAAGFRVVGTDPCERLLREARRLNAGRPGVQFACTPLANFQLDATFDVVVAGSAALNRLERADELPALLHCVAAHLTPGGLFLFDVLGENSLMGLSGQYLHYAVEGCVWVVVHDYHREERWERTLAIFEHGIETHRRIPLDASEVASALASSGLAVADRFGDDCYGLLRRDLDRQFYVLRKTPTPAREPLAHDNSRGCKKPRERNRGSS